jgi:hypothetical protein
MCLPCPTPARPEDKRNREGLASSTASCEHRLSQEAARDGHPPEDGVTGRDALSPASSWVGMARERSQGTATLPKLSVSGRAGVLDRFLRTSVKPRSGQGWPPSRRWCNREGRCPRHKYGPRAGSMRHTEQTSKTIVLYKFNQDFRVCGILNSVLLLARVHVPRWRTRPSGIDHRPSERGQL